MPLPELDISLGITDNPGSPFYGGKGFLTDVSKYDSGYKKHKITIIISDEETGRVKLQLKKNQKLSSIELPAYKMLLTDSKTNESEIYQVTRDTPVFKKLKTKSVGTFSLFGLNLFSKKVFSMPTIAFEPSGSTLEKFEVSRYRTLRDNFISYALRKDNGNAFLFAGELPEDFLQNNKASDGLFYVFDNNNGKRFIGDMMYREKLIKTIPLIEVKLIRRSKISKKIEMNKRGKINRIIYLQ